MYQPQEPDDLPPVIQRQSSHQTNGQKIAARLWDAKASAGKPMTQEQVANVIDGMIKEIGLTKARKRVNGRDQLFDGLCVACGIDPTEVTRPHAATIGTALADIAAVAPDLTPEEFGLRANKYKRLHADWELTPSALATHWGELGSGDIGQTLASRCAAEPANWQDFARQMFVDAEWSEGSIALVLEKGWSHLSLDHRKAIQNRISKPQPAARQLSEQNQ